MCHVTLLLVKVRGKLSSSYPTERVHWVPALWQTSSSPPSAFHFSESCHLLPPMLPRARLSQPRPGGEERSWIQVGLEFVQFHSTGMRPCLWTVELRIIQMEHADKGITLDQGTEVKLRFSDIGIQAFSYFNLWNDNTRMHNQTKCSLCLIFTPHFCWHEIQREVQRNN